jgi:hypothetical protein
MVLKMVEDKGTDSQEDSMDFQVEDSQEEEASIFKIYLEALVGSEALDSQEDSADSKEEEDQEGKELILSVLEEPDQAV